MSKPTQWLIVSLPTSISTTKDPEEAFGALQACIAQGEGGVVPFSIPEFKIGTLDALVQQAEELSKLDSTCQAVTHKVADTLRTILDGDEEKIAQQKTVNDKPVPTYLNSFSWNKARYRVDRPIGDHIDRFSKEITGVDNDVKTKYGAYNQAKTSLSALQKKQIGNLATRSLASVVPPSLIVHDSEYIETHLIAVPNQQAKEFLKTYESLLEHWIVPRSATKVDSDSEYTLFTVTTFKKYSHEFIHKVRENKWTPRDFTYKEGGDAEEKKELDKTQKEERRLWGETLRLARTSYSEAVEDWIHVLALRAFVETVLRYGLPLDFVCGVAKVPSAKQMKKVRGALDDAFSFLAGNALNRDKRGRAIKDDMDMQTMGGSEDYSPYVCYEFEIN